MDEVLLRHRRELKDLQGRITQKKKQASKKTRKGVNDECDSLEAELKARQAAELASFDSHPQPATHDDPQDHTGEASSTERDTTAASALSNGNNETLHPPNTAPRRPNRQKARLARREADREEIARQAAEEAENLPDAQQQERDRMLAYMAEHKLKEKEIRADGHCLYSAVADQLLELGVPLGTQPGKEPEVQHRVTRNVAADYIEQHGDDFAGFLEEPLAQYVHKVRDTAEWGGQLELQALAKAYEVQINVLQDFGRIEKILPDGKALQQLETDALKCYAILHLYTLDDKGCKHILAPVMASESDYGSHHHIDPGFARAMQPDAAVC